jgi:5-methylcytosine-specific restriction endonuclease McrA
MALSHIPLASLERKKINGRFAPTIPECQCKHCGETYRPKRSDRVHYCSRQCAYAHRDSIAKAKPSLPKECGQFRVVVFANCLECGVLFAGRSSVSKFCAETCRARYVNRLDVGTKASRCCIECGSSFVPAYGDKRKAYCSRRCSNRAAKRSCPSDNRKRARRHGVQYEPLSPIKVFVRDGWTCQICGCNTPQSKRGTLAYNAPELDHRIPISKGGGHTWANVQCACRRCNGDKSNKTEAGQLPLFVRG